MEETPLDSALNQALTGVAVINQGKDQMNVNSLRLGSAGPKTVIQS